jgi:hypothetical protein
MFRLHAVPLLAAALRVSAQISSWDPLQYTQSNLGPSDAVVYVDLTVPCTETASSDATITATITATTCPACSTHKTTYTTVYPSICSTGTVDVTYTITETCTGPTPSWHSTSGYVPPGYTVTETVCTVCNNDGSPTKVTVTEPCGACTKSPTPPPTNGNGGGKTTTVTKKCSGGSTLCPTTSTTTGTVTRSNTITMSRSSPPVYTGQAAATTGAQVFGGILGGALAVAGLAIF